MYCSVQAYTTALSTTRLQNREDLVETVIVPQMVGTARGYVKEMEEKEGKLERVTERLLVVRETKRKTAEIAEQEVDGRRRGYIADIALIIPMILLTARHGIGVVDELEHVNPLWNYRYYRNDFLLPRSIGHGKAITTRGYSR